MTRTVHPIEAESYRRLRARLDTSGLPPLTRAVVERVVHASADLAYATDLVCEEASLRAGYDALRAGAPIVADVGMVAAGITSRRVVCSLRDAAAGPGLTRSAHAVRLAYEEVGPGAVWVIGCAPTALAELLRLDARPALVVGLPVGFVGAAESKAALRASGLPAVSNVSEKGGSAVAAAAVNALLYAAASGAADAGASGAPDPGPNGGLDTGPDSGPNGGLDSGPDSGPSGGPYSGPNGATDTAPHASPTPRPLTDPAPPSPDPVPPRPTTEEPE